MKRSTTGLLGRLLRRERERQGVSLRELAIRTGLTIGAIWRCEARGTNPRFQSLVLIERALGLEPGYFTQRFLPRGPCPVRFLFEVLAD